AGRRRGVSPSDRSRGFGGCRGPGSHRTVPAGVALNRGSAYVAPVRRLAVAFGIVAALAGGTQAEFVARARDFKCLKAFTPVPGKSFVVYNRNPSRLRRAIRIAANDLRNKHYPIGTIVQVFPFEAMVKRGGPSIPPRAAGSSSTSR